MILTFKIKHDRNFDEEISKAHKIANFAISNRNKLSTKYVKHIGLKSVIANQILKKYGRDKKCKKVKSVKLIIPSQGVQVKEKQKLYISSLKLTLSTEYIKPFEKINQIELDNQYAYVAVTIKKQDEIKTETAIGVDLNATGHIAVIANLTTGKIQKFGKKAPHVRTKYKSIRKNLQKKGRYKDVKKIKNRESRIVRDINHKISKKIVQTAKNDNAIIVLEDLKNIRKTVKTRKSFRYSLNSWSFYQLKQFINYKAKLQGIPISHIDPAYTSKICSKCGRIGKRTKKHFECGNCNHVDHADVNAAFNIAKTSISKINPIQKEMNRKGSLIPLRGSDPECGSTLEPLML